VQLEDAAVEYFEAVIKQDNIKIDMKVPLQPETLQEYIEGWRRKIWDQGFHPYLKGGNYFKKGDSFTNSEGSNLVVRRVLYQYVSRPIRLESVWQQVISSNSDVCMLKPLRTNPSVRWNVMECGWL
jgi:hypothetical protein